MDRIVLWPVVQVGFLFLLEVFTCVEILQWVWWHVPITHKTQDGGQTTQTAFLKPAIHPHLANKRIWCTQWDCGDVWTKFLTVRMAGVLDLLNWTWHKWSWIEVLHVLHCTFFPIIVQYGNWNYSDVSV